MGGGGAGADDGTFESPHTELVIGGSSQPSREVNLLHGDSTFDNGGSNYEITSNQLLVSESAGNTATISTDQGAATLPEANPSAATRGMITNGGVQINSENVTIQNVSFNNAGISTAAGNTHENLTISNVSIVNAPSVAVQLGGASNGTVRGAITLEDLTINGGGIFIEDSSADVNIIANNVNVDEPSGLGMRLRNLDGTFAFNNVDLKSSESGVLTIDGGIFNGTMDAASSMMDGGGGGDFVNIGDGRNGTIA
jgi:hypothetical protein